MEWEPFFEINDNQNEDFYTQLDEDLDFALALSLQSEYESEVKENHQNNSDLLKQNQQQSKSHVSRSLSIVDEQWELIDPHPDIHGLFLEFNAKFFYGALEGVEVRWSSRMTLCAGVCCYEGRGGLCSVRLSLPLLKLRPRRDLVETLLHEMIHALLFVTENNKDHDGHGPEFQKHMHRINQETGTRISIFHSFHDEVDLYRKHWWKCNGPCINRRPFFGVVKRAMNRAPGPRDTWWSQHQASCGGTFTKIKEPDDYKKKSGGKRKITDETLNKSAGDDIRSFFTPSTSTSNGEANPPTAKKGKFSNVHTISSPIQKATSSTDNREKQSNVHTISSQPKVKPKTPVFSGQGYKLGSSTNAPGTDMLLQQQGSSKSNDSNNNSTNNLGIFGLPSSYNVRIPGVYAPASGSNSSVKGEKINSGKVGGGTQMFSSAGLKTSVMNKQPHHKTPEKRKSGKINSGKVGGGTRMFSSTGSKTIVINKPPSHKTPEKKKIETPKERKPFAGQGQMLAETASSDAKSWLYSTPTKEKSDRLVQSPMEKYFHKTASLDSIKENSSKIGEIPVILSDTSSDDDSFVIGSPSKSLSTASELLGNDAASNGNLPDVINLLNGSNDDLPGIENVDCPVCGRSVKNSEINNHLDSCLM